MRNGQELHEEMAAASIRSLGFDDPNRMKELTAFLEIDPAACREIRRLKGAVEKHIPKILDQIYDHLQQFSGTRALLTDPATVARLKGLQLDYFDRLMSGNYDTAYVRNVVRVGLAHGRVGVEPEWYMGTYAKYLCGVMASLFDDSEGKSFFGKLRSGADPALLPALQTLIRIFFLDMTLTIKSYIGPLIAKLETKQQAAAEEAERLKDLTGRIVGSVNDNAERMQSVSASTEGMNTAIREISKNILESTRVTAEAVSKTDAATQNITNLKAAAENIGRMTKAIHAIAEQTNLLALNATIESARAGEAGRGFAVVANEVKDLSKGTARATEEITRMISSIRKEIETAVAAITELQEVIQTVNHIITGIAGAVEEQSVNTNEISKHTTEASTRMASIADEIRRCNGDH